MHRQVVHSVSLCNSCVEMSQHITKLKIKTLRKLHVPVPIGKEVGWVQGKCSKCAYFYETKN